MILPDINILIHAHNLDSRQHEQARQWWDAALSSTEWVGLPWASLLGFIRISTNRAILRDPWPVEEALQRVEAWLAQPNVRILHPTHRHAEQLARFLRGVGTAGNLTTDAHLAALAMEHGCTLYSTDADFARFPGLSWRNPLVP
ncbi:MAG: type II toxin-antitoxin system VapC family toxin [Chloroflexota bacterium]